MKVGFFTYRLIYGGGEKVQNWVAHQLLDANIEVAYLSPVVDDKYLENLKLVGLYERVDVIQYPHGLKSSHPFRFINKMKQIYIDYKIDAILIFGGSLLEEIAACQLGKKVILSERCNPNWRKLSSRILKKIQYRFGDAFVFQTVEQSRCYSKFAQQNCRIILNPIIDDIPIANNNTRKEIVTIGRLSIEKNIEGIIDAFYNFHLKHADYKLLIYGNGPREVEIRRKIDSYHLDKHVKIIQGKRNISELISGAALCVFNSNSEGMPNSLIEAMSVGLPCISSDCPIYGPRAIIQDGVNGFLVPVNNSKMLYRRMCEVIEQPELSEKLKCNALNIRQKLDKQAISKKWVDYIYEILQN